jgi:oxygen-independent coproporphyrinogen-3 oxidase
MNSLGVNRVSFGVQSFDDEKLKFLGRAHNRLIVLLKLYKMQKV